MKCVCVRFYPAISLRTRTVNEQLYVQRKGGVPGLKVVEESIGSQIRLNSL